MTVRSPLTPRLYTGPSDDSSPASDPPSMGTEQRSVKYPTHSPYSDLPFRFGLGILGGPGTNPTNEDSISDTKTSLDSVSHGSSPNVNSFQKDRRYISYQIVFFTLIDLWVNPPTPSGPRVIPSLLSTYL